MRRFARNQQWIVASRMYPVATAAMPYQVARFSLSLRLRQWRRKRGQTAATSYRAIFPSPEADPLLLPVYALKQRGQIEDIWTLVPVVVISAEGTTLPRRGYIVADAVAPPVVGDQVQLLLLVEELPDPDVAGQLHRVKPQQVHITSVEQRPELLYHVTLIPKE